MPQHWGIKAHYWSVDVTESESVDLLCYQPVTDGRGDPAAWPRRAEGRAATELFICLTLSQPGMGWWGVVLVLLGWIQWAHGKLCLGRWGCRGTDVWAGLITGGPSRPKLTHHSPSQCVDASPLVQRTLTASLVNSLVTANSRALTRGETAQWLIKGGQRWPRWMPGLRQLRARHRRHASPASSESTKQRAPVAWQLSPAALDQRQTFNSDYLPEQLISQRQDEGKHVRSPTRSQVTFPEIGFLEWKTIKT